MANSTQLMFSLILRVFSIKALARLQQTEELKLWLCKLPQTGFKLTQAKKLEFNPNLNNGSGKNNEFSRENSPAQQSSDKATAQVSKVILYKSCGDNMDRVVAISKYLQHNFSSSIKCYSKIVRTKCTRISWALLNLTKPAHVTDSFYFKVGLCS